MDRDIDSGDDTFETSFNTATEGDYDDGQGASNEPVKSSRSMPVPDHMMRKSRESLHVEESQPLQAGREDYDEAPPPSYNEIVANPRQYQESQETGRPETEPEPSLTAEEIAVVLRTQDDDRNSLSYVDDPDDVRLPGREDNGLTPAQEAVIRRTREGRNAYLERKHSFEEAIEMQYRKSLELPKDDRDGASADTMVPPPMIRSPAPRQLEQMHIQDVEVAQERKDYNCTICGPLNEPMTSLIRILQRQSRARLILFTLLIVGVLGVLLFVSLFPASFVYIDYHEIALKQSKMTNVVDRETVYYHGCYVLGPDTTLIKFDASVHNVIEEMSVFTLDTIAITIRYSAHYFLRPAEVGQLFTMFMLDYDDVFRLIIRSSIRNFAGSSLTVDNFRFNRTYVETQMHAMLRKRLGGDCCPQCCYEKPMRCQSNTYCSTCKLNTCDQGYHIDVRMFNLLSVAIPSEVFEMLLRRTLMEVDKEKEFHLQAHALTVKKTDLLVKNISNAALQISEAGKSEANKIMMIAEGEKEKIVQEAHITGLGGLFSRLNVTGEEDQLSLMLFRAFESNPENLFTSYGYQKHTVYHP